MRLAMEDKDILAKIHRYEWRHLGLTIPIDVIEVIAGRRKHGFKAVPIGPDGNERTAWCGFGDTEEEALQACMNAVKQDEKIG